jgi:hypothetical protein
MIAVYRLLFVVAVRSGVAKRCQLLLLLVLRTVVFEWARLRYDCAYGRWRETHKLLVVVFDEKI